MSLAALLDLAVFALVGVFCGASAMQLYITERYHLSRYQFRRDCPDIPPSEPNYTLADDLNVPLIEVVLDAEARADPDYWKPKPPPDALRPPPRLPDPHRTATEHAHAILNSRMLVLGPSAQVEPLPRRECDCLPWPGRMSYAEQNGPLRCGTCHGFIPHDRYVLPKALRNCKHQETVDVSTLNNPGSQSLCIHCGKRID